MPAPYCNCNHCSSFQVKCMNILMEEIRKYAGIINEDTAGSYATALDTYLYKEYKLQPPDQGSVARFNIDRIDQCKQTKDFTFEYKTKEVFVRDVMNWFLTEVNYVNQNQPTKERAERASYLRTLIKYLAEDYFDKQSGIAHETEADKDAKDRQRKLNYANRYPRR